MKKVSPAKNVDENEPGVEREIEHAEGVDPEQYKEFWAERQAIPQQDDADLETELDQIEEAPDVEDMPEEDTDVEKAGDVAEEAVDEGVGRDAVRHFLRTDRGGAQTVA